MKTFCLFIGQVACFLGVCTKILRRWDSEGKFISDFKTFRAAVAHKDVYGGDLTI